MQTLNIVDIIENNPITCINNTCNNLLIDKINESFTNDEQHLFIASFYGYLNYNKNDFVIDLDKIYKWIGFSRKNDCKKVLVKNFVENIDYSINKKYHVEKVATANAVATSTKIKTVKDNGGYNKEKVLLTITTFKKLCLKADTKKADEIHNYYIKLEEILQEVLMEESKELKQQLLIKDREITKQEKDYEKLQKEKELEKHNILLREFANKGPLVYIIKIKSYEDNTYIIKIGESRNGIYQRYKEHKNKYVEAIILDCFLVQNSGKFENFLHNHKDIKSQNIKDLVNHEKEKELFIIGRDLSYIQLQKIINDNIQTYNDYSNINIELEIVKTELETLKIINENPANFKEFIHILIDKNNRLEELVYKNNKELQEIKNILKNQCIKLKTNFGEELKTLGPRIQKINPDTLKLIKVYETMSECLVENNDLKRSSINKAINDNTIYKNFRWNFVDRDLDSSIVNIKPTKEIMQKDYGYIAKINNEKTKIITIYIDKKQVLKDNCFTENHLNNVIKYNKLAKDSCYYMMYDKCELKDTYKTPVLYRNGVGKYDINNNLIQEYVNKFECVKMESFGNKTLTKILTNNIIYNGFYYRYVNPKLKC